MGKVILQTGNGTGIGVKLGIDPYGNFGYWDSNNNFIKFGYTQLGDYEVLVSYLKGTSSTETYTFTETYKYPLFITFGFDDTSGSTSATHTPTGFTLQTLVNTGNQTYVNTRKASIIITTTEEVVSGNKIAMYAYYHHWSGILVPKF